MSTKLELFGEIFRSLDNIADTARATNYEGLAEALTDAADFFKKLYDLGDAAETALDNPDTNAELRVAVDFVISEAVGLGAGVVFAATAGVALATVGAGGVTIVLAGFAFGQGVGAVVGQLQAAGLTPVPVNIDYSNSTEDQIILGTIRGDTIITGQGDDFVRSRGGPDEITQNGGSDSINGGNFFGDDVVNYERLSRVTVDATDSDTIRVFHPTGTDTLTNVEVIIGTFGNDSVDIGGNQDIERVEMGWGDDLFNIVNNSAGQGSGSIAHLDGGGGEGTDTIYFVDQSLGSFANLEAGRVQYGQEFSANARFTVEGIENVIGTEGRDVLIGNARGNSLYGGDENDRISGGGGDDTLDGAGGSDELNGGAGKDTLTGGEGGDQMEGGAGDDTFIAGDGDRILDSDGVGRVFFNGVELKGATRPFDPDNYQCGDENETNNSGDEEDKYIGDAGEEYERSGGGLVVTLGGSTLTITGWSQDALGITLEDEDPPEEWTPPDCFSSPLVLDLDGDGIELVRLDRSNAFFDLDRDGAAERTAWVNPDDGILALDLDGNDLIDDASELFGYGTTFPGGARLAVEAMGNFDSGRLAGPGALDLSYASGFDKLAELDLNFDGVIDQIDTFYNSLRVWRDLDGDGVSDDGELFGLAESGVASINLDAVAGDRRIEDSLISDTGSFVTGAGTTQEISDVWFLFNQFDAKWDRSNITPETAALPEIQGTGALPDLQVAMADDPQLRAMVADLATLTSADFAGYRGKVEEILFRWAGVDNVSPYSRGPSANGRELAFIEVVSDTPFMQWSGPDPRSGAGQVLDLQFQNILRDMMVRLAAQTPLGDELIAEIAFNNGAFIDLDADTQSSDMLDAIFSTAPTGDWGAKFQHVQAGVLMLDRVFLSFADIKAAGDDGAAYKADVEARLATAGFGGVTYDTLISANVGTEGEDSLISTSYFLVSFVRRTELTYTGAGDDELKWGNKEEILLWGAGQGNDEIDVDVFFARPSSFDNLNNVVRMQELTRADVTIRRGDSFTGNDIAIEINATGETLTFRNLLLADNAKAGALVFADGEVLRFSDLEGFFASLAEAGTDGEDRLYQRQGATLDGGAGDDVLQGGAEATTYVFGTGYGLDEIFDTAGRGTNTVVFGSGITLADLEFSRPVVGSKADLYIRIPATGDELRIYGQFANESFVVTSFRFDDGTSISANEILDADLTDTAGNDALIGSGRAETFGAVSPGNDVFTGLRGDDLYLFDINSGQDLVEDMGSGRYNPARSTAFYRDFFVDNDRGDFVEIGFRFDELTASRTATRLTFLHEPSGAQLTVDNTRGFVERYRFVDDETIYTLPEVMELIDGAIEPDTGSANDDILTGDDSGNIISGGQGDDTIFGLGGPDTLNGDEGNDLLDAGDRGEVPSALRDNNSLFGGVGNDSLLGGWEDDLLEGGAGNDSIEGDFGFDTYDGGLGNDTLFSRDGDVALVYELGDGNDLYLGTDNRFDETEVQLGAGLTSANVTFSIALSDVAGLTDYFEFRDVETAWSLLLTMPDGGSLALAGSRFADNLAGLDRISFDAGAEVRSVSSILSDLFQPSDEDQTFIGWENNDTFALGGGNDNVVFAVNGGFDTVSLGLGDGQNTVIGQLDRLAFETPVLVEETTLERFGEVFENLLITLVDGTSISLGNIITQRQVSDGVNVTQDVSPVEIRFGDGTVFSVQDILDRDIVTTAGDDVTTGDTQDNILAQSVGNDLLRGSGGSDVYFFGAGAGQDTVLENVGGFAYYTQPFEAFEPSDLSQFREIDELRFDVGLTIDDLTLTRTGTTLSDLRITLDGTSDSMLILNQFAPMGSYGVNRSTGQEITQAQWQGLDEFFTAFNGSGPDPIGPGGPIPPFPGGPLDPIGPGGPAPRTWGDDPVFAAGIEKFVFSDGTELGRDDFAALLDGSDNAGNNEITTDDRGGTLDGGAGNDTLLGGAGNDTYVFDAGYASNMASDAGGTDTLALGAGLPVGNLTITRQGDDLNDLLIEVGGLERTAMYVEGQFANDGREIEVFTFADGSTLTAEEIRLSLLTRSISNGDDCIVGFETSDVIDARRGDDKIEVRGGNDLVDGGAGFDTVVLRGARADYEVLVDGDRIVVTDLTGRDGINRLFNVEQLVFADDPIDPNAATEVALVANQAPVAGPAGFSVQEDGRLTIFAEDLAAAATDPDGATLIVSGVGVASSGQLEARDEGGWTFTPDPDFNGDVTFEYSVLDAGGLEATGTATITVTPVNDAPVAGPALADVSVNEDTPVAIPLPTDAFSDADGDVLTITAALDDGSLLPAWLNFDGTAFTGTPPADFNGRLDLMVTASDGSDSATQTFALIIAAVNDAPQPDLALPSVDVNEGALLTLVLPDGIFSDADGEGITLEVQSADGTLIPAWLDFDAATRTLSGTPPDDVSGAVELVVIGSDGLETATVPLSINVLSANAAPVLVTPLDDTSFDEDTAVSVTIPAGAFADPDDDTLTLTAALADGSDLPGWLIFDGSAFTGTPPADFNGNVDVRVTASDGDLTASDVFALTITPVNDAPVLVTTLDDTSFDEDTAVSVTIPAGAFADPDDDTLTLTAALADGSDLPGWLIFDGSAFTGTPPADFNGNVDVRVTASDGDLTASDVFALTITPVNDSPDAIDDGGFAVDAGASVSVSAQDLLSNDTDPDGDTLLLLSVTSISGGSAVLEADGSVTFDADAAFDGTAQFSYTVTDGAGGQDTALVNVSVTDETTNPYDGFRMGTDGDDVLFGRWFKKNFIFGKDGNDYIWGGLKHDHLAGGDGADKLFGLTGKDTLDGNSGADVLFGGFGNDVLSGGRDDDHLYGGFGHDTFVYTDGDGADVIGDFQAGASWFGWRSYSGDRIALDISGVESGADALTYAYQDQNDVVFDFGGGDTLRLEHTWLWQVDQSHIDIV